MGYTQRKNQDWFDDHALGIYQLLEEKKAHEAYLANPQSIALK